MKILICGLGSIGKRHAKNLIEIGQKKIIFFRKRNLNFKDKDLEKIRTYNSLESALKEKPNITFICNNTSDHIDTAIKCALSGSHLFIEKPLSNSLFRLEVLEKIVIKKKLKVMIGYNMRFHPLIKKVKKIVDSKKLGEIYKVKSEWSEYLPNWHPWENYKRSYAANKNMGGGCSLTLSHELDLLYWLFGEVKKVFNVKTCNYLGINVDTASDFLIHFKNNIVGYVHLDFLQRPYVRNLEIIGTKKKLFFDYYDNQITITNRSGKLFKIKIAFKKNEMYKSEIKYFLNCVKKNIKPSPSLNDSKYILNNFLSAD